MEKIPMYPKLAEENKILGLEFADLLILTVVYLFVFVFFKNLFLNLALVGAAYIGLVLFKRKKPPRYTQALIRFLILPRYYSLTREDQK
jgi:hypothetical protein